MNNLGQAFAKFTIKNLFTFAAISDLYRSAEFKSLNGGYSRMLPYWVIKNR